jgi:hypothetical protein
VPAGAVPPTAPGEGRSRMARGLVLGDGSPHPAPPENIALGLSALAGGRALGENGFRVPSTPDTLPDGTVPPTAWVCSWPGSTWRPGGLATMAS